ncbi:hypothetical protein HYH02_001344 [Chlamydomonas schloesseri]|uniref:Uncharacterized protein n=1 Tax=Chlamydomonas schloesseri TaxID=2026947 RepID=A0A835WVB7_9CHLO|nr:hypothetical protein HYH02_001344 [Chlamydomonas schloesseri]|eukprot:KAG2454316.1 hypothetical protein HYH02_001344 [Chlamydomonas schloesseri]
MSKEQPKARRELNWWHSFNSWWRDEYDKLGRRPRMQEVDEWYHENAERIWGAEKPSLEATRDHAKCLRSKKELREYFQRYNAKKFGKPFTDLRQARHQSSSGAGGSGSQQHRSHTGASPGPTLSDPGTGAFTVSGAGTGPSTLTTQSPRQSSGLAAATGGGPGGAVSSAFGGPGGSVAGRYSEGGGAAGSGGVLPLGGGLGLGGGDGASSGMGLQMVAQLAARALQQQQLLQLQQAAAVAASSGGGRSGGGGGSGVGARGGSASGSQHLGQRSPGLGISADTSNTHGGGSMLSFGGAGGGGASLLGGLQAALTARGGGAGGSGSGAGTPPPSLLLGSLLAPLPQQQRSSSMRPVSRGATGTGPFSASGGNGTTTTTTVTRGAVAALHGDDDDDVAARSGGGGGGAGDGDVSARRSRLAQLLEGLTSSGLGQHLLAGDVEALAAAATAAGIDLGMSLEGIQPGDAGVSTAPRAGTVGARSSASEDGKVAAATDVDDAVDLAAALLAVRRGGSDGAVDAAGVTGLGGGNRQHSASDPLSLEPSLGPAGVARTRLDVAGDAAAHADLPSALDRLAGVKRTGPPAALDADGNLSAVSGGRPPKLLRLDQLLGLGPSAAAAAPGAGTVRAGSGAGSGSGRGAGSGVATPPSPGPSPPPATFMPSAFGGGMARSPIRGGGGAGAGAGGPPPDPFRMPGPPGGGAGGGGGSMLTAAVELAPAGAFAMLPTMLSTRDSLEPRASLPPLLPGRESSNNTRAGGVLLPTVLSTRDSLLSRASLPPPLHGRESVGTTHMGGPPTLLPPAMSLEARGSAPPPGLLAGRDSLEPRGSRLMPPPPPQLPLAERLSTPHPRPSPLGMPPSSSSAAAAAAAAAANAAGKEQGGTGHGTGTGDAREQPRQGGSGVQAAAGKEPSVPAAVGAAERQQPRQELVAAGGNDSPAAQAGAVAATVGASSGAGATAGAGAAAAAASPSAGCSVDAGGAAAGGSGDLVAAVLVAHLLSGAGLSGAVGASASEERARAAGAPNVAPDAEAEGATGGAGTAGNARPNGDVVMTEAAATAKASAQPSAPDADGHDPTADPAAPGDSKQAASGPVARGDDTTVQGGARDTGPPGPPPPLLQPADSISLAERPPPLPTPGSVKQQQSHSRGGGGGCGLVPPSTSASEVLALAEAEAAAAAAGGGQPPHLPVLVHPPDVQAGVVSAAQPGGGVTETPVQVVTVRLTLSAATVAALRNGLGGERRH